MIRKFIQYCTASRKRVAITCTAILVFFGLAATIVFITRADHPPTISISGANLQEEINHKNTFYQSQHNTVNQQTLRSDTIRQLAGDHLVYEYAKIHNIIVSQNEIDIIYQRRAAATHGEQTLLAKLSRVYGIDKQQYLASIQLDILKDKVQSKLGKPLNTWLTSELLSYHIIVTE